MLQKTFQWNIIWNSKGFIQENPFENIICQMAAILSRPQYVHKKMKSAFFLPTIRTSIGGTCRQTNRWLYMDRQTALTMILSNLCSRQMSIKMNSKTWIKDVFVLFPIFAANNWWQPLGHSYLLLSVYIRLHGINLDATIDQEQEDKSYGTPNT